jgi:hypothetical protein
MSGMTKGEINALVYKYIEVDGGYLRGFSYSQHDRFYIEFCDLPNIDVPAVRQRCTTTRYSFLDILENATPVEQARIIRGTLAKFPPDQFPEDRVAAKTDLAEQFKTLADRLEGNVVGASQPTSTTDTVQRALADAEALTKTRGPVSAVDRVHTALHGHLAHLCRTAGITLGNDPSVTQLWSMLIAQHPKLQIPDVRKDDIKKILRSASAIVDSINTIRNRASLGHPNEELVDEDEAWLVINVTRSLLHYLDRKLGAA